MVPTTEWYFKLLLILAIIVSVGWFLFRINQLLQFMLMGVDSKRFGNWGTRLKMLAVFVFGQFRMYSRRSYTVAGIEDRMQLRVTGEGSGGVNGGPPGDLYVLVHISEHELFTREGADLVCDLPVSFANLALGHEAEVPVLGGTTRLKIPAGTQPGEILRLRGKGMPHLRHRGHGDACYRVVLEVPQKLNAKQRETLAAFEAASKEERGPLASAFFERMKKLLG